MAFDVENPGYRRYYRAAAVLAFVYAGVTLAAAAFSLARVGVDLYDPTYGTAGRLLRVYGDAALMWAARLEAAAGVAVAAALPAVALYLARRTPGLAFGGLAVGALAFITRWLASLVDLAAYSWGRPDAPALFLALPPSDLTLIFTGMAEALTVPASLASFVWLGVWGAAFARAEPNPAARVAAFAMWAAVFFTLVTWGAVAAHIPLLAYAASWLQAAAAAAAWGGAGWTLRLSSRETAA